MAVSSNQPHATLSDSFVDMASFASYHSFVPKHSPSTTSGSDHSSGSVSPPSCVSHGHQGLPSHVHNTLFADDDDLEDDSFESVGMGSKFHATFHAHDPKQESKPLSAAAQACKLKSSTAERRATHNAIERARRESLNGRFLELARALPTMGNVKRPSKSVIVNKSLEWICESQMREMHLVRENNFLRAQVNELRAQLQLGPLPPTGFGNSVPMPPSQFAPFKPAPLPNIPIGLPATPNLYQTNAPASLPGHPTGMNRVTLPLPSPPQHSQLGSNSSERAFTISRGDSFGSVHDHAPAPFHTQHQQQTAGFPLHAFSTATSLENHQSGQPSFGMGFDQSISQAPLPAQQGSTPIFQASFDSEPSMSSGTGSPSPGHPYYPTHDEDAPIGREVSPGTAVPSVSDNESKLDLFGNPIADGSTVAPPSGTGSGMISHPINSTCIPHHLATLPLDGHVNEGSQLGGAMIDMIHHAHHARGHHRTGSTQAAPWLEPEVDFGARLPGQAPYMF